jgi:hypothetical protein
VKEVAIKIAQVPVDGVLGSSADGDNVIPLDAAVRGRPEDEKACGWPT